MIEIELKARVDDVASLTENLSGWAMFKGCCHKDDTYWKDSRCQIQIRIRRERTLFAQSTLFDVARWPNASSSVRDWLPEGLLSGVAERFFVTYKRKELVEGALEVNQEQEFQVDRREPLEIFLQDAGFSPHFRKEKLVAAWEWEDIVLELCFIPDLGNFLELEMLDDTCPPPAVSRARHRLRQLLARCGIAESAIEGRFYSQLLNEVRSGGTR